MKKDKYKIQIGDVLYEPSKMYGKVIEHKILDIYFENYVSGYKTIVVTESYLGKSSRFSADVLHWLDTAEKAEEVLNGSKFISHNIK